MLQPTKEHPARLTDEEFDAMFTVDEHKRYIVLHGEVAVYASHAIRSSVICLCERCLLDRDLR